MVKTRNTAPNHTECGVQPLFPPSPEVESDTQGFNTRDKFPGSNDKHPATPLLLDNWWWPQINVLGVKSINRSASTKDGACSGVVWFFARIVVMMRCRYVLGLVNAKAAQHHLARPTSPFVRVLSCCSVLRTEPHRTTQNASETLPLRRDL